MAAVLPLLEIHIFAMLFPLIKKIVATGHKDRLFRSTHNTFHLGRIYQMRYYLLDRVEYLKHHQKIIGLKNITLSEDIFDEHFFGNPVMPGALQIESFAQAGTVLLEVSHNFTKKALLVMINHAKFRRLVRPGDQMRIEMKVNSINENLIQMDGVITVKDDTVTTARMTFSLQPIDDFYPPALRHLIDMQYNNFLSGTKILKSDDDEDESI